MNTNYIRVIPRDLFNEAKLLKCIGYLVLQIHDNNNPCNVLFEHDDEAFVIGLLDEGYLQIANIRFEIKGRLIKFVTTYNSKSNYPLCAYYDYCEYPVFDDNGKWNDEFIDFCNNLN